MERIIQIGDKAVPMKATASTLTRYRSQFGRDLIEDFAKIQAGLNNDTITGEVIDMFVGLCHTMARQADPQIPAAAEDWVDQFEVFPIREVLMPVTQLWADSLGVRVEVAEEKKA